MLLLIRNNRHFLYFFVLLLGGAISLSGCKKWVDVNYDPSQQTEGSVTLDQVLVGVLENQAAMDIKRAFLFRWLGYYCVPMAAAGSEEQTYNITPYSPGFAGSNYSAEVRTCLFMESRAQSTGQTFYGGIAKVMRAMAMARDVDVFNNIPYREAGQPIVYPYPKYDNGQFIYEDLMKVLDTAIQLIKGADVARNTRIVQADVMYHGEKAPWVKFINTLKLRLLIHQACRPDRATYIQTILAGITTEGSGFLGSGETAGVNSGFTDVRQNGYFSLNAFNSDGTPSQGSDNQRANVIAMNFLKLNNDPRLAFFYTIPELPLPPGADEPFPQLAPVNYRGNEYGRQMDPRRYRFQNVPFMSRMGGATANGPVTPASAGILKGYDMPAWMITSVESLFMQAEAVQRGWWPGDAKTAYLEAVRESFRWLNVGRNSNDLTLSDAIFNNWYNAAVSAGNGQVSWDHAADKYKLLAFQKYNAMNGIDAQESWNDYRRNGSYPVIPLSADPGRTSATMPIRLPYPSSEYDINRENVLAQGEINIFTSKIWWMP